MIKLLATDMDGTWLNSKKEYDLDKFKQAAPGYEVVYVPTHRSHMDYLLLSYLLYTHGVVPPHIELARSSEEEKRSQLARLQDFHARHAGEAPAMLQRLQRAVIEDQNVFAVLMDAVRVCSLGQITHALFEVGGEYRRNM